MKGKNKMRSFKDIISINGLKRQEQITNMLLKNGFNYDEASDSAYIIYTNNQDTKSNKELIKIASKHI